MTLWQFAGLSLAVMLSAGCGAYLGVVAFFVVEERRQRQMQASLDRTAGHLDAIDEALRG